MGLEDRGQDRSDARLSDEQWHADLERRDGELEQREMALVERERAVADRERAIARRMKVAEAILAEADERDAVSNRRDVAAARREMDQDLLEMLDPEGTYPNHWPERRRAAEDRLHAMSDRAASRIDRIALTEGGDVWRARGSGG